MKFPLKSRIAGRNIWARMSVNFLFIPGVMAFGAVLLAWSMFWLDGQIPNEVLNTSRFIVSGSVGELRGYLFAMATTVLTTAGVVFTLLTLPLSTVAAQYGSRLLRIFLGDRTTQFVLGMFVATFAYCIFSAMAYSSGRSTTRRASDYYYHWIVSFDCSLRFAHPADPAYQHHAPGSQYRGCGGCRVAGGGP